MKVFEVVKQQKTAAFAFGRLNPATIGHELLVKEIQAQPGDAFLFLSDRPAKLPDDPLESQEKLDWARKSFNGIEIGLAKTALIAADRLFQLGYTDLIYLEGEPKMGKIIQDYNGKETKLHHYNFDTIKLVRLTRNADADDATGMSASKLRGYVMQNDLIKFKKGVTDNAQPYAEEMFKTLQVKLGAETKESVNEEEKDLDPITLQRILKFADDRDRYNSGTSDAVMSTKGTNELIAKARAQAKRDRIKNTKAHAHRKDGVHKQGFKKVKFDPVKWEPDSYTKVDLGGGRKDVGEKDGRTTRSPSLTAQPHLAGLEDPDGNYDDNELRVYTKSYRDMYKKAKDRQAKADARGGAGASYQTKAKDITWSKKVLPKRTKPKKPRT